MKITCGYTIEMETIVNCTPHSVTVETPNGAVTIPASGTCPRVREQRRNAGTHDGVPISEKWLEPTIDGLPDPQDGVIYVVSTMVAQAAPHRTDLVVPDEIIRDDGGNITGCKALARIIAAPVLDSEIDSDTPTTWAVQVNAGNRLAARVIWEAIAATGFLSVMVLSSERVQDGAASSRTTIKAKSLSDAITLMGLRGDLRENGVPGHLVPEIEKEINRLAGQSKHHASS